MEPSDASVPGGEWLPPSTDGVLFGEGVEPHPAQRRALRFGGCSPPPHVGCVARGAYPSEIRCSYHAGCHIIASYVQCSVRLLVPAVCYMPPRCGPGESLRASGWLRKGIFWHSLCCSWSKHATFHKGLIVTRVGYFGGLPCASMGH